MRRIRKPKLFDFEPNDSINLYDVFHSAYKEMTTLGLAPADIGRLVYTKQLSDLLYIPVPEIAVLVVIVNRYDLKSMVPEFEVVNFLRTVLNLKPNEIRIAIKELKKMGLINNFKDNAIVHYYPVRKYFGPSKVNGLYFDTQLFYFHLYMVGFSIQLYVFLSFIL